MSLSPDAGGCRRSKRGISSVEALCCQRVDVHACEGVSVSRTKNYSGIPSHVLRETGFKRGTNDESPKELENV